jgi:hypothetical protein
MLRPVSGAVRFVLGGKAAALAALFALLALAVSAPSASADQLGSECPATLRTTTGTALQISRVGAPVLTSQAGVVTSWAVNNPSFDGVTEKLKVFLPVGSELEVVAESLLQAIPKGGVSRFPVRIPVPAGVQFGAYDSVGVAECYNTFTADDKYGGYGGDTPVGSRHNGFNYVGEKSLIALAVTVEPDADGDGYGDETQDGCPTNAAVQGPCPTPAPPPSSGGSGGSSSGGGAPPAASLKIAGAKLEGNTVAVKLTSTAQAQVTVSGSVRGKPIAPAAQLAVTPGATGRAYLPLSKAMRERLAKLPRRQHLTLVVEATSSGAVPASLEVALPGRKKPARHHRHR